MIHELLFNLWNNPPHTVEGKTETGSHLFELPQFLHPGEERLLRIITEIAAEYHKIFAFTESVLTEACEATSQSQKSTNVKNGLYLEAFCNGVRDVLSGYRKEIIRLEQMFLDHPQLSLTYILSSVDKYRGIFNLLQSVINKIQSENLHGCMIFNALHKYNIYNTISIIDCGLDSVEDAADKLIKPINTVFYQHLCNWIIYGDLVDLYDEFFVCDGKTDDENFAVAEPNGGSLTNLQNRPKIRKPPGIRKFYLNWNLVPSFITEDAAESILFMGRIVWIFRNKPESTEKAKDCKTKFKKDIWEEKDVEYYSKIQELANQNFNEVEFKRTLEECRMKLTKYLWSVMLEEGNLVQHLKLIRDYYALGRGELFQQFLSVSDTTLLEIPSESIVQHINIIFQETARKMYGENDKSYSRFEFISPTEDVSRVNPWLKLQLNFEITWPLHIVFHPEVMKLYNKLFSYLLRLKKTQINLHRVWSNHILSRQKIDRRLFTLRHNLMFLVDSLQYYMQVNVIEAQFSILLKAVENANEFEDIIKVHQEFVTNLMAKTFVLTPTQSVSEGRKHRLYQITAFQDSVPSKVYNVVTKLLELCDEFCLVAGTWELELTEADLEELTALQKKTDVAIEALLFVLTSLHGKVKGGHLLQLLMHLDFNRYFLRAYSGPSQADFNLTSALGVP